MSQFGYVKDVYISKDMDSESHKGFAFVKFSSVHSLERLFGEHRLNGKLIEVKRSLQDYVCLHGLPREATQADVEKALSDMGYSVTELLLGGHVFGVTVGTAGVKLSKYKHQEQLAKKGELKVLGCSVKALLRVQKKKENGETKDGLQFNFPTRQRSSTDVAPLAKIAAGLELLQTKMFVDEVDSPLLSRSDSMLGQHEDFGHEIYYQRSNLRKYSEAFNLTSLGNSSPSNHFFKELNQGLLPAVAHDHYFSTTIHLQEATTPVCQNPGFLRGRSSVGSHPGSWEDSPLSLAHQSKRNSPVAYVPSVWISPRSPLLSQVERMASLSQAIEDPIYNLELPKREVIIRYYAFPGHL